MPFPNPSETFESSHTYPFIVLFAFSPGLSGSGLISNVATILSLSSSKLYTSFVIVSVVLKFPGVEFTSTNPATVVLFPIIAPCLFGVDVFAA